MAHFKLNETDETFLKIPQDGTVIFSGTTGTDTWIERQNDTVVRISIKAAAIATSDGGILEACIEIGGAAAKGQDGPLPMEAQLRVSQTVQVLVKGGERLIFKAYPTARDAQLLRTVVWTSDLEHTDKPETQLSSSPRADSGQQASTK